MMRLCTIVIAVTVVAGCDFVSDGTEPNDGAPETPIYSVAEDDCPDLDGLFEEFRSRIPGFGVEHLETPEVRRAIQQQLRSCDSDFVEIPDDAPPNSEAFEFNGHTYVIVPLDNRQATSVDE